MINAETCCDMQEVQRHALYCFMWELGYTSSHCSDKQNNLGVLRIGNSLSVGFF